MLKTNNTVAALFTSPLVTTINTRAVDWNSKACVGYNACNNLCSPSVSFNKALHDEGFTNGPFLTVSEIKRKWMELIKFVTCRSFHHECKQSRSKPKGREEHKCWGCSWLSEFPQMRDRTEIRGSAEALNLLRKKGRKSTTITTDIWTQLNLLNTRLMNQMRVEKSLFLFV